MDEDTKLGFIMVGNLIGYQVGGGEVEFISPSDALEMIAELVYALRKQEAARDRDA